MHVTAAAHSICIAAAMRRAARSKELKHLVWGAKNETSCSSRLSCRCCVPTCRLPRHRRSAGVDTHDAARPLFNLPRMPVLRLGPRPCQVSSRREHFP